VERDAGVRRPSERGADDGAANDRTGGVRASGATAAAATVDPEPLAETAAELRDGERALGEYLDGLCDRIEAVDPDVRALCSECDRRERLAADAAALEERYPDPEERPPLYGVPVGVKDIVHVDGFTTRAGSALPPELFAGPEAPLVTALREAGALVLGKTVTTEFAGFSPGLTRNPHDLGHTPGGSSSGSAAAVAAGMTPLAVGTQTGGSVVRPAAFCGVVGFKPTFDRIPTEGVLPRSRSVDTVGLFTRDVGGMRSAARAVCGGWEPTEADRRPVLGVPRGAYLDRASEAGLAAFEGQVDALVAAGYGVRRVRAFEEFEAVDRRHENLTKGELALEHAAWIDDYRPFYRTTTEERIREGEAVTARQLAEGRRGRETVRERVHEAMDDHGVDVWVCPAAPGPAPDTIATTGNSVMNRPWTYAGLPAVTLPAGTVDGLPVGLQCVGRFGEGERLLAWAESVADAVGR
jgi:Asp-tRNA(Asn)/Glu-tRNA(Gln) amidotransferase A subunit family amidase